MEVQFGLSEKKEGNKLVLFGVIGLKIQACSVCDDCSKHFFHMLGIVSYFFVKIFYRFYSQYWPLMALTLLVVAGFRIDVNDRSHSFLTLICLMS